MPTFDIIDLHCHILPGLDDGPDTLDESLVMCVLSERQGVTAIVATPHMGDPWYPVTCDDVRRGAKELSAACRGRGLKLDILPGGEVRLQPELAETVRAGKVLTLADTGRYLLLELPPYVAPRIEGLVFELRVSGVTPILSHPERNSELCRKPGRIFCSSTARHAVLHSLPAAPILLKADSRAFRRSGGRCESR